MAQIDRLYLKTEKYWLGLRPWYNPWINNKVSCIAVLLLDSSQSDIDDYDPTTGLRVRFFLLTEMYLIF